MVRHQFVPNNEHLAAVVYSVRELVEPLTSDITTSAWDESKHRVFQVHTVHHASLLNQLRARSDPTFRVEGEPALVHGPSGARSPIDLHALGTLDAIDTAVRGWRHRLQVPASGRLEADLRGIVREATKRRGVLPTLALATGSWCEWAWSATGWESKPWIPAVACPRCGARPGPARGLRIRLDLRTARCMSCASEWTPVTLRDLATQVAREQGEVV